MLYRLDNNLLTEKTQNFDFTNSEITAITLFENMKESLIHHKGLGLSCNQIGLPYSMFVIGNSENSDTVFACFNPKIVYMSDETSFLEEGCLSLPGIIVKKERSNEIRVRYQDYFGNLNTKIFTGMTARIFQHEYDHLNGITILKGLSKLKLDMVLKKAKKNGYAYNMEMINERFK